MIVEIGSDGTTCIFKSTLDNFNAEMYGDAPHTTRVVREVEAEMIGDCGRIRIVYTGNDNVHFQREISFVRDITDAVKASKHAHVDEGYRVLDICWNHAL